MKNNKRGVSLIILVITIIVMIILATAIIMSLSDNDIIEMAGNAKEEYSLKEIESAANIAYTDWLSKNYGSTKTTAEITNIVKDKLINQGIDISGVNITVTTDGKVNVVASTNTDNAYAENNEKKFGDWTVEMQNGHWTITGYIGTDTNVVIPASFTDNGKLQKIEAIGTNVLTFTGKGAKYVASIMKGETTEELQAYAQSKGVDLSSEDGAWELLGYLMEEYPSGFLNATSIDISDGIKYIGNQLMFVMNNLTAISYPNNELKQLDGTDFPYNDVDYFMWNDGGENLTTYTFRGGTIGKTLLAKTNATSITIGEGVTTIEAGAFNTINITSLYIPSTVTKVGSKLFLNDDANVTVAWVEGHKPENWSDTWSNADKSIVNVIYNGGN